MRAMIVVARFQAMMLNKEVESHVLKIRGAVSFADDEVSFDRKIGRALSTIRKDI